MRRVLVTGASGYVARHLLRVLADIPSLRVLALTRTPEALPARPNIEPIRGSLLDPTSYAPHLPSVDTVVHLAAATGKERPETFERVNVDGTALLLAASREAGVGSLVYVSTVAVRYPNVAHYPYARSKREAEHLVHDCGIPFTIVRPTIVLGAESAAWQSFSALVRPSMLVVPGQGTVPMQPVHVDDLAATLAAVIRTERFDGDTFTVGGRESLSVEAFLRRAHAVCYGGTPRTLRLPLGALLPILRLGERAAFQLVPATAGQFSAFQYDSAVGDDGPPDALVPTLRSLDAMLAECCA